MNDQTIRNLDDAIESNPGDAAGYINRGYAYYETGDYDRAIEDFDKAVRLCPNYETDFIDSNFVHGREEVVETAIELLDSRVNTPSETATDYYYAGVSLLFVNNKMTARKYFEVALKLGYEDSEKVQQHLENLKKQR